MKKTILICQLAVFSISAGYAAPESAAAQTSTATLKGSGQNREAGGFSGKIKKINDTAISEKKEDREGLAVLGSRIQKDIKDLEVDQDFIKAARDKSLDWKTRYLLIERMGQENKKKITKDEELTLYSDALSDGQEHNEVRKLAAELLMEPARTEMKARETLAKAAKDKNIPGEVLQSVMVSVGYSGIDDTDALDGLMNREPKTSNEIGINLNAVRALGQSKDPRAIGMLLKILDESEPDSFFQATALELIFFMVDHPEKEEKLRPMLTPRLLKLLDDRSYIGASRRFAGQILLKMKEKRAIAPIIKWLKPKSEGGGGQTDIIWAAEILAEFKATEAIPELEKIVRNFADDPKWADIKNGYHFSKGLRKFPDEVPSYQHLQECLKKLKGQEYNRSGVMLPWKN